MGHQNWGWKKRSIDKTVDIAVATPTLQTFTHSDEADKENITIVEMQDKEQEEVVKEHVRLAEEAVSGWERAQADASALRMQLEEMRSEKEAIQKVAEELRDEVEKLKDDKESLSVSLQQAMHGNRRAHVELRAVQAKADAAEKERCRMRYELHLLRKEIEIRSEERESSVKAADVTHRHYLENLRKLSHLQAECQRLRDLLHRKNISTSDNHRWRSGGTGNHLRHSNSQSGSDHDIQSPTHSLHSQSRVSLNNLSLASLHENDGEDEMSCADSWASALLAELDGFNKAPPSSKAFDPSELSVFNATISLLKRRTDLKALMDSKERAATVCTVTALFGFIEELLNVVNCDMKSADDVRKSEEELRETVGIMDCQLNESHFEIGKLQNQVCELTKQLECEKDLHIKIASQYQESQAQLQRFKEKDNGEDKLQKLKKEMEMEVMEANEKLIKCQKTIEMLEEQLESWTSARENAEVVIDVKNVQHVGKESRPAVAVDECNKQPHESYAVPLPSPTNCKKATRKGNLLRRLFACQ